VRDPSALNHKTDRREEYSMPRAKTTRILLKKSQNPGDYNGVQHSSIENLRTSTEEVEKLRVGKNPPIVLSRLKIVQKGESPSQKQLKSRAREASFHLLRRKGLGAERRLKEKERVFHGLGGTHKGASSGQS